MSKGDNHEGNEIEPANGQFLVYQGKDGEINLAVRLQNETVWLTQQLIAELFQIEVSPFL
jgi:hypothetical protein